MNIILVGKHHGQSRSIKLGSHAISILLFVLLVFVLALVALGAYAAKEFYKTDPNALVDRVVIEAWDSSLNDQKHELRELQRDSKQTLDALTLKMGDMQARIYRL
ncbi:hypothetical protein, partial [Oleiphilus sp. HI0079]